MPVGLYTSALDHSLLNFTGGSVVVHAPAAGTCMVLNLTTGATNTDPATAVRLKGYQGLGLPSHVLGLPGTDYPTAIPYGLCAGQ